jgi:hypothetical protein
VRRVRLTPFTHDIFRQGSHWSTLGNTSSGVRSLSSRWPQRRRLPGLLRRVDAPPDHSSEATKATLSRVQKWPAASVRDYRMQPFGRELVTTAVANHHLLDGLGEGHVPNRTGRSPRKPLLAPMGRELPVILVTADVDSRLARSPKPVSTNSRGDVGLRVVDGTPRTPSAAAGRPVARHLRGKPRGKPNRGWP